MVAIAQPADRRLIIVEIPQRAVARIVPRLAAGRFAATLGCRAVADEATD